MSISHRYMFAEISLGPAPLLGPALTQYTHHISLETAGCLWTRLPYATMNDDVYILYLLRFRTIPPGHSI